MSVELYLRDPLGERTVAQSELPLRIGGEGATLAVPGVERGRAVVTFGVDTHGFYVERAQESLTPAPLPGGEGLRQRSSPLPLGEGQGEGDLVSLNGRALQGRTPFVHGDLLSVGDAHLFLLIDGRRALLHVEHAAGNVTAPPIVEPGDDELTSEAGAEEQPIRAAAFKPQVRARRQKVQRGSPWRLAMAAGLAVMGFALWVLSTSTPLHVVSDPETADIRFPDAWLKVGFGNHYLLRPGAYTLVASSPGYGTLREKLRVGDEPNQQVNVTLRRLPGKVRIDTAGVAATVLVDGKPIGPAPGEYSIAAGSRAIVLRAPRYLDWAKMVQIEGLGKPQLLKAQLVMEEQPKAAAPEDAGPPMGRLVVHTEPADANVSIAGRYRGRTPLETKLAAGSNYALDIDRAGYEAAHRVVAVKFNQNATVQVKLKPILGQITVRGQPADAQLFVEGQARGAANQTLELPAAEQKLEIKRDGYQTFATTVTPQPGFPRVVEYTLVTPEQAKTASMPPIVKTSAGAELRIIPTGSYEMGSVRREAGSRSNETRRAVVLQRPFYLGVREVTNAEFLRFRAEHLSGIVKDRSLDQDTHPVVNVSWQDAVEFCNWLSAQEGLPPAYEMKGDAYTPVVPATTGYRLPTEAEWEWAARYERGQPRRSYPWGESLPVPPKVENYADKSALVVIDAALENYEDNIPTTAPVGRLRPTALGLFDIGGNVSEWMQDFYTVDRGLIKTPATDPIGPESGSGHVIRGANWKTSSVTELRTAWRDGFDGKTQYIGFRIARYAE